MNPNQKQRVSELEAIIKHARHSYYNEEVPVMSDDDFDIFEAELGELDPENMLLKKVGIETKSVALIPLFPHMLSLEKALSIDKAYSFIDRFRESGVIKYFTITDKLDGMSVELLFVYDEPMNMHVFKRASSRGDGEYGSDITDKLQLIDFKKVFKFDYGSGDIRLRGELVIKKSNKDKLSEIQGAEVKSLRNSVVGIINSFDIDLNKFLLVDFVLWEVILADLSPFHSHVEKLIYFCNVGFDMPILTAIESKPQLQLYYDGVLAVRSDREYDIDGLVIRIDDEMENDAVGVTSHHPKGSIALKFPPSSNVTRIIDIIWSEGTTDITPVAVLEPVKIGDAIISKVSLHSVKNMIDLGAGVGSSLAVIRSGDVIPKAEFVASDAKSSDEILSLVPLFCFSCGEATYLSNDYAHLSCTNFVCPAKFKRKLEIFAKALDMKNFGPGNIGKIVDSGKCSNFIEFMELSINDFSFSDISLNMSVKLLHEIKSVKSVSVSLGVFLAAIQLNRVGYSTAKVIASTVDSIHELLNLTTKKLIEVGIGVNSSVAIVEELLLRQSEIELLSEFFKIKFNSKPVSSMISGMKIVITGATKSPRSEWKEIIESLGAKLATSVSSNVDYLCTNVTTETTKYVKAKSLGIRIISESELEKICGL